MIDVTAPLLTREEAHSLTPVLKEGKKIKIIKVTKKNIFIYTITQQEGEYWYMKIGSEKNIYVIKKRNYKLPFLLQYIYY